MMDEYISFYGAWRTLLFEIMGGWVPNSVSIGTGGQKKVEPIPHLVISEDQIKWASSWDYGTYQIGDQRRPRRACASAQSRQSLRCSHTWSMEADEESDQKSDI